MKLSVLYPWVDFGHANRELATAARNLSPIGASLKRTKKRKKNLQQEGLGGAPFKTFLPELAIYPSDNKEETGR